jgi:hypothetical protein
MPNDEDEKNKPEEIEPSELPTKVPEPVRAFFSSIFASRHPIFPPFMEKINEEHIARVLDYSEKEDERDFEDAKSQRRYRFATFLVIAILFIFLFVFLTVYLVDRDRELYKDIVKLGLGFLSGLALGGGVAYNLGRRSVNKNGE